MIRIPYDVTGVAGQFRFAGPLNDIPGFDPVENELGIATDNTSAFDEAAFAVFTEATLRAVPLPASAWPLIAGLTGLTLKRRSHATSA